MVPKHLLSIVSHLLALYYVSKNTILVNAWQNGWNPKAHNTILHFLGFDNGKKRRENPFRYRTQAIITRGLYIIYPIFQCGL